MHMIINHSSMVPIYEQIMNQLKSAIIQGELEADTMLPSVRGLSGELKISALTVKKVYDCLEEEGYVITVHGKGIFVSKINPELLKETKQKEVEEDFMTAIEKAYGCITGLLTGTAGDSYNQYIIYGFREDDRC